MKDVAVIVRHGKEDGERIHRMVSVVGIIGVLVIIGINTAATALMTRFFRVRLETSWGPVVFALLLIPVVLIILTQILGGIVIPIVFVLLVQILGGSGLELDIGGTLLVISLTVVIPLVLGTVFDYFWMPDPDEVELPERSRQNS
jgi:hypothetical protein